MLSSRYSIGFFEFIEAVFGRRSSHILGWHIMNWGRHSGEKYRPLGVGLGRFAFVSNNHGK